MLTLDIEIVEKHAEGTATLYRVSTGILKKPLGSSRFSSRLLYVVSTYVYSSTNRTTREKNLANANHSSIFCFSNPIILVGNHFPRYTTRPYHA